MNQPPPQDDRRPDLPADLERWGGPALIALAALAMAWWTWQTWPDVVVDFGRELYVPWQLGEGQLLYRDLAYFNGPLSPYWNALWFGLLGASVRTLALVNLVLLGLALSLLFWLLRQVSSRLAATSACLVFVFVFAFGQQLQTAGFNWVCPYSHEITHGVLLGLAALAAVARYQRCQDPRWLGLSGALLGLAFLTKPEAFLGAAAGAGMALAAGWWLTPGPRPWLPKHLALLLGCAVAPPLAAWLLLSAALPAGDAARDVAGGWAYVGDPRLRGLEFYQRTLGTFDLPLSLRRVATWSAAYGAALVPATLVGLRVKPKDQRLVAAVSGLAVLAVGALAISRSPDDLRNWEYAAAPLSATTLALVGALVWRLRQRPQGLPARRLTLALGLAGSSLLLLAKIGLAVRAAQYGFALAAPAAALSVVALCCWLPRWVQRRGGSGWVPRAAALALLGVVSAAHLACTAHHLRLRTHVVGQGPDAILADARGGLILPMLEELKARVEPGQTLAVLPEGATLNFFVRRASSTPFVVLMPPETLMFGDERIQAAFATAPPDWILLVHKDTRIYGPQWQYFGRDFLRPLRAWIDANYQPVVGVGAEPLVRDAFGLLLLRRVDRPTSPAPSPGGP